MAQRRPDLAAAADSTTFAGLGLPAELVAALAAEGVTKPFPIQAITLPDALAGRNLLGRGRTGSGKTYAFALPLLARLAAAGAPRRPGRPRGLVLAPTRELASQIEAAMAPLARALSLRTTTIFGGVRPGPQITALKAGVDVVVACPGRLADLMRSGHVRLDEVDITVLDEADHMADLGFLPVVRDLLERTPRSGQRMLFSATLDSQVQVLVRRFLTHPVTHQAEESSASQVPTMAHHVLHVSHDDRMPVLVDLAAAPGRTLVFTRTKQRAKTLTRRLVAAGVRAVELHGNLAQNARSRNLLAFAEGAVTTLVATDIAARGVHVDGIALVVHADPPVEYKAYLHRSGRTARAGAEGTVITLMTDDQVGDVRKLAQQAGIAPTTTRLRPGDPLLTRLAPGSRTYGPTAPDDLPAPRRTAPAGGSGGRGRKRGSGQTERAGQATGRGRTASTGHGRAPSGGRPAAVGSAVGSAAAFSARGGTGGLRAGRRR